MGQRHLPRAIQLYLVTAGRDGEFYRQALELLDFAEEALRREEAARLRADAERRIQRENRRTRTTADRGGRTAFFARYLEVRRARTGNGETASRSIPGTGQNAKVSKTIYLALNGDSGRRSWSTQTPLSAS
jgi:hypothetical protein